MVSLLEAKLSLNVISEMFTWFKFIVLKFLFLNISQYQTLNGSPHLDKGLWTSIPEKVGLQYIKTKPNQVNKSWLNTVTYKYSSVLCTKVFHITCLFLSVVILSLNLNQRDKFVQLNSQYCSSLSCRPLLVLLSFLLFMFSRKPLPST